MKIAHRICCGVDVHKRNIVATIAATDKQGVTRYFTATFSTILSAEKKGTFPHHLRLLTKENIE